MELNLPNLSRKKCLLLTACGHLEKDIPLLKEVRKKGPLLSSYNIGGSKVYVRVATHETYLHIDFADPQYFENENKPASNHTIAQLKKKLSQLEGKKVDVRMRGEFRLATRTLPPEGFIRAFNTPTKLGKIEAKLTRGKLEMTGSSVGSVSWQFKNKGKTVEVMIDAMVAKTVGPDYFTDACKFVSRALSTIVLEGDLGG